MNEKYAAIIIGISVFVLVMCFFAPVLQKSQEQEDAVRRLRKKEKQKRRDLSSSYRELKQRQKTNLTTRAVDRRNDVSKYVKASDKKTARRLSAANINLDLKRYGVLRIITGVVLAAIILLAGSFMVEDKLLLLVMSVLGLCGGMMAPQLVISRRVRKRKEALLNSMPDAMDLLSITTNAGLGFEAAIMRIAEGSDSPCIQELRMVVSDIQHGISKKNAYLSMKERCDLKEMSAFVTAVIQSEELGTSVTATLTQQAEVLRQNRRIRAEERANKAPVKITIPLIFCIFPSLLIVLVGPALQKIIEAF